MLSRVLKASHVLVFAPLGRALLLLVSGASMTFGAAEPARPNFVLVLGEGHGWSSTSVPMDDAVPESRNFWLAKESCVRPRSAHQYTRVS